MLTELLIVECCLLSVIFHLLFGQNISLFRKLKSNYNHILAHTRREIPSICPVVRTLRRSLTLEEEANNRKALAFPCVLFNDSWY